MPPLYHRVWYWLRLKAQWEPYLFPTRRLFGIWVLPGQRLTSIQQIAEGVKYFDNHREIIPDKRTISRVLEWLEFNGCIAVTSNACATLIHIINWGIYNDDRREPVTGDVLVDVLPHAHKKRNNKNYKEVKEEEDKEEPKVKRFVPPTIQEITDYCIERKNTVDPETFFHHYETRNWVPTGYTKQMTSWKSAVITWEKKNRKPEGQMAFSDKPKAFRERVNDAAVEGFLEKYK